MAIVVFSVAQQPAPENQGAAKSNRTKSTAQANNTASHQTPPAQPDPADAQVPIATVSQGSPATANDHARTSDQQTADENHATQRKLTWFTGVLAGVGVLQLVVMFLTWLVYRRQAGIMEGQRTTMQNQWTTMQGQLGQMETAGKQTDKLIAQATTQAEKTGIAAEAARESAEAFVLSERAWIQVHIAKPPEAQVSSTRTQDGGTNNTIERVWFWPDVMNFGRTPAKMTKIIVVTCQIPKPLGEHTQMPPQLPTEPRYDADYQRRVIGIERDMMLAQNMGITPIPIEVKADEWERITSRKSTLYLYGFIDYLDVVNEPHQTRFCEVYWVPANPNDPNAPGFITAGNTPAAYTECT